MPQDYFLGILVHIFAGRGIVYITNIRRCLDVEAKIKMDDRQKKALLKSQARNFQAKSKDCGPEMHAN
jgi:hypothetical protein